MTEADLVSQVRRHLTERGIETLGEVPFYSRSVDFVLLNPLTAVEAKLRDWRKALTQAQHHLWGYDYSYVLLPKRKVTEKMRNALEEKGIGLYLWDGFLIEAIPAMKSTQVWEPARRQILRFIEELRKIEGR